MVGGAGGGAGGGVEVLGGAEGGAGVELATAVPDWDDGGLLTTESEDVSLAIEFERLYNFCFGQRVCLSVA